MGNSGTSMSPGCVTQQQKHHSSPRVASVGWESLGVRLGTGSAVAAVRPATEATGCVVREAPGQFQGGLLLTALPWEIH